MGPWGPDMPVRPDVTPYEPVWDYHCPDLCCDNDEDNLCRCDCSWCDCRYADRQGS